MPAKRTYTDEQLDYIKRYWRKYPTKLMAQQLGMTPCKVDNIANYHGLRKNKSKARTPLPEFVVYKINKRPQVVELDMTDKDRMEFVVKTGNTLSGDIKLYGQKSDGEFNKGNLAKLANPTDYTYKGRIYKETDLHPLEPQLNNVQHMYYDPPIVVLNKPRKNWLQRLVSWLLTGEV